MWIYKKGAGGVAILIPILALVFGNVLSDVWLGDDYSQSHKWVKATALIAGGAFCFALGRFLNTRPPRPVHDRLTKTTIMARREHSLYHVPLEFWGPVIALIGVIYWVVPK